MSHVMSHVIDAKELAESLGIPRQSILRHRAGLNHHPLLTCLPEPAMSRPRLVWWVADIEAWIESRRTFRTDTPTDAATRRGPGRPRKAAAPAAESGVAK